MKCPYCEKEIHLTLVRDSEYPEYREPGRTSNSGFGIGEGFCPSCDGFIVLFQEGNWHGEGSGGLDVAQESIIYPRYANPLSVDPIVPAMYKAEIREAYAVNSVSPKASAAISRRLLQSLLQNEYKINKNNLSKEITEFVNLSGIPSYITDAVDAIRRIGNLAAHPTKSTNTGEIIDVEPGEAEWLLEILAALFDFTFVQPEKLRARKEALQEKLDSISARKKEFDK